jgi:glycosyltransferase involved in cell wall biosynthesis
MTMNTLMILDSEFPPDERVEKEAVSLINAGNSVSILCLNYGSLASEELYKGIHIHRIKINRTFRNKLLGTFLITPFYRIIWRRSIIRLLAKFPAGIIHIHDLPLSDIGISLQKSHKIKIVCDQHEFYSNWIVNTAHYNTFPGRIVKALSNWKKYERINLNKADLVITVEEPLRKIYLSEVGIDPEKIIVIPNTPSVSVFNHQILDNEIIDRYRNNFMIFYAGHLDILRGIDTIIESLPLLRDSVPGLKFVFAGQFTSKYYNPLKYIEKLGVSDMTEYLGWKPLSILPSYIAASNVCIHVPPATSLEVNSTVSTKIYQYIMMRKPVIVGSAVMMRQFVEDNMIGLSSKDSDPEDLAEKIKLMFNNPDLLKQFSENAGKIASQYSWEETSKPLIESYNNLIS